jgi:glycosyltransferase involved in cell wall biosynthesis
VLKDRVAIYIGGLEPIYNIEALLRAAELLDEWSILIVGAGTLQRRVEDAARTHDSVEFLGSVPHETVPGLLQIADVGLSLVDDSRTLKILEYGAAGLPVVQLEGNARDRFGESLNYCSNDPKEIVTAIRGAQLGGTNMLREVSEQLDWKNIADTYIEVIESAAEDAVLN